MGLFGRPPLDFSGNTRIAHLLVVAGPPSSGKSTFLRDLASGRLPAEVTSALPAGAEDWAQTGGSRLLRGSPKSETDAEGREVWPGLALHYDMLRPFETSLTGYDDDPALSVLRTADHVVLVLIKPTIEQLARQMEARQSDYLSAGHRVKRVRRRLSRLLGRRRHPATLIYEGTDTRQRKARLAALYRQPDFLPAWYRRWQHFAEASAGSRLTSTIVMEPAVIEGRSSFRIVEILGGLSDRR